MRSAEEAVNPVLFHATNDRMVFATGLQGGVWQDSGSRCGIATFLYLTHSSVLIPCESAPPVPSGRKRGGRERPPKKSGGHVTLDSWRLWHASIRPHGGRSRPHLSLREGSETAPRGGAERRETDL